MLLRTFITSMFRFKSIGIHGGKSVIAGLFQFYLCVFLLSSVYASANWPEFRGPNQNGIVPPAEQGSTRNLPTEWSESKNIKWKTPIPYRGWSTPVIWDDQIWLTTATEDGKEMFAICADLSSGKITYNKRLFYNESPRPLGNRVNGYASPSPTIEDGRVYIHFGSYGTACLNTETKEVVWQRRDLPCDHYRGPGSSPVIYKDLLILTMDGVDLQYQIALDKQSGDTVWKTDRTTDFNDLGPDGKPKAGGDYRKDYSTPIIVDTDSGTQLIITCSKAIYGYNPDTGDELWKLPHTGFSNAARAVYADGLAYISTGSGRTEAWAIHVDGRGEIGDDHIVWRVSRSVPKMSSPVLVDNLLYMVSDGGIVSCVNVKTGEEIWKERIGGNYFASPIYADGKIYFFSDAGKTTIIKEGREFKVIAVNELEDGFMASPAVSGDSQILRTKTHLYRVESMD